MSYDDLPPNINPESENNPGDTDSKVNINVGADNNLDGATLTFGAIASGDHSVSISPPRRNRRRLVYAAMILSVVLILGLLVFRAVGQRQPPGSAAFPAAQPGETLIVIASVADPDSPDQLRQAIAEQAATLGLTNLRVELAATSLAAADQAGAAALGNQYAATIVIWGAESGGRVTVNVLNLRQPDFAAGAANIDGYTHSELVNPSAAASVVTTDLPAQMRFVALFTLAQSSFSAADYATSLRTLESAIATLDRSAANAAGMAEAYFREGWLQYQLGYNLQRSIEAYDQAIRFSPSDAAAHNNRGVAQSEIGDFAAALADFDQAMALDPTAAPAYNNRGILHAKDDDLVSALADLDQAISLDPSDALAYYNRANVHVDLDDLPAALADLDQAIKYDPSDAAAYYNRGNVHVDLGDLPAALADYDHAISLDPTDAAAYYNRGFVYHDQRKLAAALVNYDQAISLDPTDAAAYYNRGIIHADMDDLVAALADFDQAIILDPTDATAYFIRGRIHADLDETEKAGADFKQVLELSDDPELTKDAQTRLQELGVEK
jgi:tetratricopeptide (TPR) repeat protein